MFLVESSLESPASILKQLPIPKFVSWLPTMNFNGQCSVQHK